MHAYIHVHMHVFYWLVFFAVIIRHVLSHTLSAAALSLSPDAIQNLPLPFANFVRSHNLNGIIYIFYLVPFPSLFSPLLAAFVAATTTTTTIVAAVFLLLSNSFCFSAVFSCSSSSLGGGRGGGHCNWGVSVSQSCSQSCWLSSLPATAVPVPCFYLPWRMRNKYHISWEGAKEAA